MLNKALVIAISYIGTNAELRGCVSDGERIYQYLKKCAPDCEIRVLCDDRRMKAPIHAAPTYSEILRQIDWLVRDATGNSRLWISYSGHGGSQRAREMAIEESKKTFKPLEWLGNIFHRDVTHFPVNSEDTFVLTKENSDAARLAHAAKNTQYLDVSTPSQRAQKVAKKLDPTKITLPARQPAEIDGANETILPSDFGVRGDIVDDVLRQRLVDPLPAGARLTAFFDSCHSGTVLDLRYNWLDSDVRSKYPAIQKTEHTGLADSRAQVLLLSGCRDAQTSADAQLNGIYCGATTQALLTMLDTLQNQTNLHNQTATREFGDHVTNDNNLDTLDEFLHAMNKWMSDNNFSQRPQISLGRNEDVKDAVANFFPLLK